MKYLIIAAAVLAVTVINGSTAYAGCGHRQPIRNAIKAVRSHLSSRPVATALGNVVTRPTGSCSSCGCSK